jgi:hypothetical protein
MAAFAARFMTDELLTSHAAPHYEAFDVYGQANFCAAPPRHAGAGRHPRLSFTRPDLTLSQPLAHLRHDVFVKTKRLQVCPGYKNIWRNKNAIR